MRALGEEFRAAREARGLSLSDVAEQIHIRSVYLQALENEDWAAIGAPVYVRGFIRTYARFLGLDPESSVQRYNESAGPAGPAAPPVVARESAPADRARRPSLLLWISGALAIVLVAAVVYQYLSLQRRGREPVASAPVVAASPSPLEAAPVPSDAVVEAPSEAPSLEPTLSPKRPTNYSMTLRLTEASWVRVIVDGQNDMEGLFPPGTMRSFHGRSATVRIGNAGGVDVDVNGKSLGKLGNTGDVVERTLSLVRE